VEIQVSISFYLDLRVCVCSLCVSVFVVKGGNILKVYNFFLKVGWFIDLHEPLILFLTKALRRRLFLNHKSVHVYLSGCFSHFYSKCVRYILYYTNLEWFVRSDSRLNYVYTLVRDQFTILSACSSRLTNFVYLGSMRFA